MVSSHKATNTHANNQMSENVPEAAKATALLQCLSKHLIFANVIVTDGATSESHGLFKVVLPDLWHRIILFNLLWEKKKKKKRYECH